MKFSIKDFLSKCDKTGNFLRIWSHLLKKSLMEHFIFCAVLFGGSVFVEEFVPKEVSYFYPRDFNQFKSITNSFFFVVQSMITKLVFQNFGHFHNFEVFALTF